jgi:hypothetical protein
MDFSTVKNYVIFLRYKRSGSALLVNLLDAHPNIIFVRNEELFGKWNRWTKQGPERLFDHLYHNAKRYKDKPFSANGYKYPIEGVGKVDVPLVVGHKSSTRRMKEIAYNEAVFRQFEEYVGVPLKFVHLIRDPYHQVSARWQQKEFRRTGASLTPLLEHVREQLEINRQMRRYAKDYYQLYYEKLVGDPKKEMRALLEFLEVDVLDSHLDACDKLVEFKQHKVLPKWELKDVKFIDRLVEEYSEFLGEYK